MRKGFVLLLGAFVLSAMLLIPQSGFAASFQYNSAWEPSDNSMHTIHLNFTFVDGTSSLNMYDWESDGSDYLEISNDDQTLNVKDIYLSYIESHATLSEGWYAGYSTDAPELFLGDTTVFGLFFNDNAVNVFYMAEEMSEDNYELTDPGSNMVVYLMDAHPVPIPSAAWIFGAGIVGLVGIRRKVTA